PGTVKVLLGQGDGAFQAAQSYVARIAAGSVAVGDFDGDGQLDLAVASYGSDTVSVLLGNGNGTFQAAQYYDAGIGTLAVAVGDFNGDGRADLVVIDHGGLEGAGSGLSILLGKSDGTFQAPQFDDAGSLNAVAVGDFNGDGQLDLADNTVVLLGKDDG